MSDEFGTLFDDKWFKICVKPQYQMSNEVFYYTRDNFIGAFPSEDSGLKITSFYWLLSAELNDKKSE